MAKARNEGYGLFGILLPGWAEPRDRPGGARGGGAYGTSPAAVLRRPGRGAALRSGGGPGAHRPVGVEPAVAAAGAGAGGAAAGPHPPPSAAEAGGGRAPRRGGGG